MRSLLYKYRKGKLCGLPFAVLSRSNKFAG